MAESFNTASAFTIRELTGQRRTVRMVGRALPYRPFSLKTQQRVETTWLPGSPEATATVLGRQDAPTTVTGSFKDKYLGVEDNSANQTQGQGTLYPLTVNGESVLTARAAEQLFDSIAGEGQVVEVTWDETVRQGFLSAFSRDWHNTHDLFWEMTFTWIGRGEGTPAAVLVQETSVADTGSLLQKKTQELVTAAQPPFQVAATFAAALGRVLTSIAQSSATVQGSAAKLARTAVTPIEASRRTVAACTAIVEQTQELTNLMNANVYYAIDTSQPMATMGLGVRLRAANYARTLIDLAHEMRRIAIIRRSTLITAMEDLLLAVYTAREDEDLRDVSRRFYGSPFEWRTLLAFNNLTTPALSGGQIVLVPKIQRNGGNA